MNSVDLFDVSPDMYMMKRFMGTCLMGPSAMSHDLLALSPGSADLDASACSDDSEELNPAGDGRSALAEDAATATLPEPVGPREAKSSDQRERWRDMVVVDDGGGGENGDAGDFV